MSTSVLEPSRLAHIAQVRPANGNQQSQLRVHSLQADR